MRLEIGKRAFRRGRQTTDWGAVRPIWRAYECIVAGYVFWGMGGGNTQLQYYHVCDVDTGECQEVMETSLYATEREASNEAPQA